MAKFLQLTGQNGDTIHTNPDSWQKFTVSSSTGADKKPVNLTVIRYQDGTVDKVRESVDEIARLTAKG